MGCVKLLKGLDLTCQDFTNRYYQSIVLINRSDVEERIIRDTDLLHRISFSLKENKTGYLFTGNETASIFSATFQKTEEKGIPYYDHQLQLPVVGTDEGIKTLLKQLDASDYFAAIQLVNGTVEIYGFENGLTTGGYTYAPQGGIGGAVIPIGSRDTEYAPPYIYYGKGNEEEHFNNLFANIGSILGGDFNDDFSNDFHNTVVP